jgi:ATP-dependent exoDNAse (exonuclease V) beta subunit
MSGIGDIPPVDAIARNAVRESLDETLVVEAAAGAGKTTELVERILEVLASGRATMVEIVAVTFTEKAAGELKLRLREALEKRRASTADDEVRRRLEHALETLEEAHVNTIHGFCAELLRERPVEARVDPLFVVLTEAQAARIYDRAFGAWLEHALANPAEAVRRALRRTSGPVAGRGEADGPVDRLRDAGRLLAEWRDFQAPWARPPFDRASAIDGLVAALHHLADLTASRSYARDNLYLDTAAVRRLSGRIRLEQSFNSRDLDGWEARLVDLLRDRGFSWTRKGSGHKFGANVTRTQVLAARDELFAKLQQFKHDADADLAAALQQELSGATARYQQLKAEGGALDFADLLARARDLIKGHASVRRYLQKKFTRIFVDEFQDTDPVQAEILMLLAADDPDDTDVERANLVSGKLFIVGDPKQAIYRFRGTDVGTYWRVAERIARRGGRVLRLTTSYRSVPHIQQFVNAAFNQEMVADETALQGAYVPLSPFRDGDDSQPAVVALPVPRPYSTRGPLKPSAKAIEASLPDAVGAFLAWLLDEKNGWRVVDRAADGSERHVQVQPKHIAVLFRRFVNFGEDVTRAYTNAIEARGIPHLLVGGKAFQGREEVETIRAALAAVEWPDDELSVFATLKGSLFAIDDDLLLEYRHRFGAFHPFRIAPPLGGNSGLDLALAAEPFAHLAPIADALRLIQRLHRGRNVRPVAETISCLLTETRAHVGFVLRPAGEQALANVLHVAELARQFEASGGISFRGFIDELRDQAESESGEAPILEESSDGVRLMTVHKAKGLEFPVVVLADLTCRLSRPDASRYLDSDRKLLAMRIGGWAPHELHLHAADEVERDRAEGIRLAYVAATRARDLLVVPALGDGPWEGGWLSPLNRALYPPIERRRSASRGPKCPAFTSKDSVLERPDNEPASKSTVSPGLHTFPVDGYAVVWWDPGPGGGLTLGERPRLGVRRGELIAKDVPKDVVAEGRSRYDRWRLAREAARARGAVPSLMPAAVREWAADPGFTLPVGANEADVSIVDVGRGDRDSLERGGGAAFGALVHAVLATIPLGASLSEIRALAALHGRILSARAGDVDGAVAAVEHVLRHPLLLRAQAADAAGRCRRETPVTVKLADSTLLEGVVDLAFEEQGTWTVVDYKTDPELASEGELRYRRQVAVYAAAIREATGAPATAVLLRI